MLDLYFIFTKIFFFSFKTYIFRKNLICFGYLTSEVLLRLIFEDLVHMGVLTLPFHWFPCMTFYSLTFMFLE